ncbi:MAG: response regulator [Candidatus Gastranaerophilales bacterium]|nr:response regulator [Candidatus Gastranaerophilales bacterium]
MLCNTLIIDTRKELPAKYKKSISDNDTTVYITGKIKDALDYIQSREPDLIIVSDSISEPLGDFCEKIRVLTYNLRPIIVALSKSDELKDKIKVLEAGADDYISEPVNIKEFQMRIKAHLRRELETNLDNKTLLPNKKYSIRTLKRTLADNSDWATLLISIENFKHYIEVYTEFAGDKVIQTLLAIIKSTLTETDFLSRLSEMEFLIITKSAAAEKLASYLTYAFDAVAPRFYSHEDTKRGYMLLQGDDEAGIRIEFVSLLISVISSEFDTYINPEHLINKMQRIKNLAKLPSKSNYIVDRPKISGEIDNQTKNNKKIVVLEPDLALELLLRTTLELQGYDVLTTVEENEIPAIFIIDAGDNENKRELCSKIKNNSIFVNSKIIMTSNHHDKSAILNTGADLYLPKPYELSTLIKWVEYFMNEINY